MHPGPEADEPVRAGRLCGGDAGHAAADKVIATALDRMSTCIIDGANLLSASRDPSPSG